MQVWIDWAPAWPGLPGISGLTNGRQGGERWRRPRGNSWILIPEPALVFLSPHGVPFRHFLQAREQAAANEFGKNEW